MASTDTDAPLTRKDVREAVSADMQNGHWEQATSMARSFLEVHPDADDIRIRLGQCERRTGDTEAARATLERLSGLSNPYHLAANYNLALIASAERQHSDAIKHAQICLQDDPEDARYHAIVGMAQRWLGQLPESAESLRSAIALSKRPSPSWFANLGFSLSAQGETGEAIASLRKAHELAPQETNWRNAADELERQPGGGSNAGRIGAERTMKFYDDSYSAADSNAPVEDDYLFFLWSYIADQIAAAGNRPGVLDIGCGPGTMASVLAKRDIDCQFTGIDFSEEAIRRAKAAHPEHSFHVADLTQSDLLARLSYDVVVCTEFLEHVENDLGVVEATKPGTQFFGSVPDFDSFGHVRHFNSAEDVLERYRDLLSNPHVETLTKKSNRYFIISGVRG